MQKVKLATSLMWRQVHQLQRRTELPTEAVYRSGSTVAICIPCSEHQRPTKKRSLDRVTASRKTNQPAIQTEGLTDQAGIITNSKVLLRDHERTTQYITSEHIDKLSISEFNTLIPNSVHYCNLPDSNESQSRNSEEQPAEKEREIPFETKLEETKNAIAEYFPKFFTRSAHPYNLYRNECVLEISHFGGKKTYQGMRAVATQMALLKMKGNFMYVGVNAYIINITSHPEEKTIKMRWTVRGVPQLEGFKIWKFIPFGNAKLKEKLRPSLKSHDGFSTFWVDDNAKIVKHRIDNVMPDESTRVAANMDKLGKIITSKAKLTNLNSKS